jgi:hypothetical protein
MDTVKENTPAYVGGGVIGWLLSNRLVLIILLILFIIFVVPWLVCDVMGLKFICTILSAVSTIISKVLGLFGL